MICISKKGEKEAKTGSCCVRGNLGARTQEFQRPSATREKGPGWDPYHCPGDLVCGSAV